MIMSYMRIWCTHNIVWRRNGLKCCNNCRANAGSGLSGVYAKRLPHVHVVDLWRRVPSSARVPCWHILRGKCLAYANPSTADLQVGTLSCNSSCFTG
jgi:hypothetical protein